MQPKFSFYFSKKTSSVAHSLAILFARCTTSSDASPRVQQWSVRSRSPLFSLRKDACTPCKDHAASINVRPVLGLKRLQQKVHIATGARLHSKKTRQGRQTSLSTAGKWANTVCPLTYSRGINHSQHTRLQARWQLPCNVMSFPLTAAVVVFNFVLSFTSRSSSSGAGAILMNWISKGSPGSFHYCSS